MLARLFSAAVSPVVCDAACHVPHDDLQVQGPDSSAVLAAPVPRAPAPVGRPWATLTG
jgi:hypothetical protein